jgi:hypothetical protein
MNVVIEGEGRLDLADEIEEEFVAVAAAAVAEGAQMLLVESKRLVALHGQNAPAPPGSTPATVSGDLLRLTKPRSRRGRVRGNEAAAGVQYAPHSWLVEYGHMNVDGTRTLPRPFVRPAVENTTEPVDRLLRERLS